MSRYFRLKVPERQIYDGWFEGGFDIIFDKNHFNYLLIRDDGSGQVYIVGEEKPFFIYKDEVNRLLKWMYDEK